MTKEIQEQRYTLYDQERQSKIDRCISKRQEIIANTKQIKPKEKNKSFNENSEEEGENNYYYNNLNYEEYKRRYKIRNTENNYIFRKSNSTRKQKLIPINKVIVTDNSYTINNGKGKKSTLTQDEIDKIQCIKDEKAKLRKKSAKKNEQLMRYLQVELDRVHKINKVKEKLNKKNENIKEFIKVKNKTIKQMENDRYQDHQDINERQKIYKKMLSNYDQKLYLSKQLEKNKAQTLDKINTKTNKKMEELSKQIQDYEDKNNRYKEKITKLFDLKDKEEMDKIVKERIDKKGKNESPLRQTSTDLIKKRLNNFEEKLEIEKYRRENALMISMNKFQDKISNYLVKSGEKEKKIKNTLLEENKKREDIRMKKTNHFNDVRNNVKKNEELKEEKRQKLIEDIQKKDLKTYAIKEEKKKINEEKMKMNKLNREERNAMKLKIQEIINKEKNFAEGEKNEELIQKLMSENNNNNSE